MKKETINKILDIGSYGYIIANKTNINVFNVHGEISADGFKEAIENLFEEFATEEISVYVSTCGDGFRISIQTSSEQFEFEAMADVFCLDCQTGEFLWGQYPSPHYGYAENEEEEYSWDGCYIRAYTNGPCALIQKAASGQDVDEWDSSRFGGLSCQDIVKGLDNALDTESSQKFSETVLRTDGGRFFGLFHNGEAIVDNYLSTTVRSAQVMNGSVRYKITGVTPNSGCYVQPWSGYQEDEWLFKRHSRFQMLGKETDGTYLVQYEGRG